MPDKLIARYDVEQLRREAQWVLERPETRQLGVTAANANVLLALLNDLTRYKAALEGMVEHFGLCFKAMKGRLGIGIFEITPQMEAMRCGECPPCKAREALEGES